MILWVAGMTVAAALWLLAFASTRYVDKSEEETTTGTSTHPIPSCMLRLSASSCRSVSLPDVGRLLREL
jgi:hypothetical protein